MATPYHRLFGLRSLNGMVRAFDKETRLNTMFQDLFREKGRQMETEGTDETIEWDETQLSRSLAPIVGRDSPHPMRQNTVTINRTSSVAHIKEGKFIHAHKLYGERGPGELKANAELFVDLQIRDLVKRAKNTIEYLSVNTLNGTVTVNPTTVPGSKVTFTIAYAPNTYTATNSWATLATRISSQEIPALKQDHLQASGLLPRRALIGGTIQGNIAGNTEFQNLMRDRLGPEVAQSAGTLFGQALGGFELGDLTWDVNEAGYVPDGGVFTRFIPATDDLFLLPADEDLPDVLGMALGLGLVPGNDVGPADMAAELIRPAPQRGFYSYAVRSLNPLGVWIYVGWVGMPLLVFPSGLTVADVVP